MSNHPSDHRDSILLGDFILIRNLSKRFFRNVESGREAFFRKERERERCQMNLSLGIFWQNDWNIRRQWEKIVEYPANEHPSGMIVISDQPARRANARDRERLRR